jgi:hypothetical protein
MVKEKRLYVTPEEVGKLIYRLLYKKEGGKGTVIEIPIKYLEDFKHDFTIDNDWLENWMCD